MGFLPYALWLFQEADYNGTGALAAGTSGLYNRRYMYPESVFLYE